MPERDLAVSTLMYYGNSMCRPNERNALPYLYNRPTSFPCLAVSGRVALGDFVSNCLMLKL